MNREEILQRLAAQRSKVSSFQVKSLAVFGSVARGEARADSDVDILVEFQGPATFDGYMKLKTFLEDVLNRRVDLLTRRGLRPELAPAIEREAVYVT